jgi:hypothetical protein
MSLLTLPETSLASTTVLRKPESLRVKVDDRDDCRVIALVDGKTTVGSSPQCTIVLPGSECRPLQCVLAVDANRVEATRWGAGVQLNHRDFTKSVVAVGDKLTIGACELLFEGPEEPVETVALPSVANSSANGVEASASTATDIDQSVPPCAAAPAPLETCEPPNPAEASVPDAAAPESLADSPPAPVALLPAPSVDPTPLASRPTVVIESPAPVAASSSATISEPKPPLGIETVPNADSWTSHAFADELILQLWQSSDQSKRRAKALIAAARDARLRTEAMAADRAAMELELDLARAAYDSHSTDHEQLHLELIERDRRASERIGPLVVEVEQLRSQLQKSQIELTEQAARCAQLNAALEERQAKATLAVDNSKSVDATRTEELEQSLAVQIEQATALAHELGLIRTELDAVRAELDRNAADRQQLEAELSATRAESEQNKHAAATVAQRDATIAGLHEELASLHTERGQLSEKLAGADQETWRLAELCQASAERITAMEQALAERPTPLPVNPAEPESAPAMPSAIDEIAWHTEPEPATTVEESPRHSFGLNEDPVIDAIAEPSAVPSIPAPSESSAGEERTSFILEPAAVSTAPIEPEAAGTSFIDKYRHLLDDEGDAAPVTPTVRVAPPMIDDEFLSPAKAADRTVPADDSDEALDAYMASMMERMRGSSTPVAPILEPTPPSPARVAEAPKIEYDPSEPFDIESMKQGRKLPVSTDLAAMREIANSSARSAIETHQNRKKAESALGKIIVAVIAIGSAGYLMWNAPSAQDWQFGVGIVVGLIGFGSAALAMRRPNRRGADYAVTDAARD